MQGSANLNIMVKAARAAGRALVKDFREVENLQVSTKGPGDFVTRADLRAEEIVRDMLTGERPNYGWLAEESAEVPGKDPTRRWIVDPLDGTTNFLHGLPHWSVSVALEHKGEVVAAVVFDPAKDELFAAEKGAGAYMNTGRLRVSGRKRLIECLFATGLPFGGRPDLPRSLKDLGRVLPACAGVRRFGAASLDLAYVAAGRFDGFWERGFKPWDVAAGLLVAREAGALVEAIEPRASIFDTGALVAGNGAVFDEFAALVRRE